MSRGRWILLTLAGGLVACCLLLPARSVVGDRADQVNALSNIREVGMGLYLYHEAHGHLPPAAVRDRAGRPLLSWRVLILPHLDQEGVYRQFRLDEPWDGPNNKQLLEKMPHAYGLPRRDTGGLTHAQVLVGPGTAFERDGLTLGDFPDGTGKTLLVVEAAQAVPWTKPADLAYDPAKPLPALGGLFTRPGHLLMFEVGRRPGFNTCFADGSARFIPSDTDEQAIRALITRNGGEPVEPSNLE
jgi:hypothetical protein